MLYVILWLLGGLISWRFLLKTAEAWVLKAITHKDLQENHVRFYKLMGPALVMAGPITLFATLFAYEREHWTLL